MEIAPNIYCVTLGNVNAYLCQEMDGLTLIDTGMPNKRDDIFSYVDGLGRQPLDIQRIILTHADIDHTGSLNAIHDVTSAAVYASRATAELVAQGRSPKHSFFPMDFVLRYFVRYGKLAPQHITIVQDEQVLPIAGGLQVIRTPGHTADHISLFQPDTGVLFAGDVLSTRGGKLQLSPRILSVDYTAVQQSARALFELPIQLFACGHGHPLPATHPSVSALKQTL